MLKSVKAIVPPLLPKFHKGQLGRILVVGGSEDYTGAPFFAAMASALVGADMSHILCTRSAGSVIKTYSPNLMVHPYLHDEGYSSPLSSKIEELLDRMHVVLIGPGLGRDKNVLQQVIQIIKLAQSKEKPLVIDADGLYLIQQQPQLVKEYGANKIVLTPNVVEFGRLLKACKINLEGQTAAKELANQLQCTLLVKGEQDIITNGTDLAENDTLGSNRRVSGQGDTLSGSLATFIAWTVAYKSKLWDTEPVDHDLHILAAWAASGVVRTASRLAFEKHGRAMTTTDVNGLVGEAFESLYHPHTL